MSTASVSGNSTSSRATAHALSFDSSSSRSSPFSGPSNVDQEGYLQAKFRAGGPYLCSLPATIVLFTPGQNRGRPSSGQLEMTTRAVLDEENIPYKDVTFCGRRSKVDPEREPVPTVLIITNRCLRPVTKKIQRALKSSFPGVCVEMTDEINQFPIRCFPVEQSHPIFRRWDQICRTILSRCDISEWVSVECWRWGPGQSASENPVTVVVSVIKDTQNQFHTPTQRIREILTQSGLRDVDILFHQSEIQKCVLNPLLPQEARTLPAHPGVSIGINGSDAGSSTLGGMVQLKFAKDGKWQTFGLTCFHCVWAPEGKRGFLSLHPESDSTFRRWELSPVTLSQRDQNLANKLLRIDHPSLDDLRRTIEDYDSRVQGVLTERCKRIRERAEFGLEYLPRSERNEFIANERNIKSWEEERADFFKMLEDGSYKLGNVFAGSGLYRSSKQQSARGLRQAGQEFVLDWALIRIPDKRRGANKPVLYDQARKLRLNPDLEFTDGSFLTALNEGSLLYKAGRSSEVTTGQFGQLKSAQVCKGFNQKGELEDIITWEYAISCSDGTFAEPGDSGAFVFVPSGGVIGLFWGSPQRPDNTNGYFTPIDDIFDDIKKVTGCVDVRIAP